MRSNIFDSKKARTELEKIYYWICLWEELINNYNKKSYGLALNNPQLLLTNIIDEIESNQFKNKDNKNYFIKQLGNMLKNDPAIKKKFKAEFTHILQSLQSKKYFYLKHLCLSVQNIFHNSKYYNELFSELNKILTAATWNDNDEESIKLISQHLITELMMKGYELKDISNLPKQLFDGYEYIGKFLITDFPARAKNENTKDIEEYNNLVQKEMDKLSIEKRLSYFIYYFGEIKETYNIIIQINGIKSTNIDCTIGPIRLYSPHMKQLIDYSSSLEKRLTSKDLFKKENSELFRSEENNNLINALISVEAININSAVSKARKYLSNILDLICLFFRTKVNLSSSSDSIILNKEMQEISFSINSHSKFDLSQWHDYLELETFSEDFIQISKVIGEIIAKPKNSLSGFENKIFQALHWYRKGCETTEKEDQLINFWILIESFIENNSSIDDSIITSNNSKFKIIQEILPLLEILYFSFKYGWELQYYLLDRYVNRFFDSVPKDLVVKCNLAPSKGTEINLVTFLNHLSDLKDYVKPKLIKDKIIFAESFFFNTEFAIKFIKDQISQMKDDILLIYRLRNKIVHNANYDDTTLSIYVQKAKKYSQRILYSILSGYCIENNKSIDDILMKKYVEANELLIHLDIDKQKIIDIISNR